MIYKLAALILALSLISSVHFSEMPLSGEEVKIESSDGIVLTGEYYKAANSEKPMILLFHQAGYSRGEYREIAPKLNDLGFSCLAIDQRSGNKVNGVSNLAFAQASKKGIKTDYVSAFPDLEASLNYALTTYKPNGVILLGSSYSSSLVFVLGSKNTDPVKGILSFSPGEYFEFEKQKIRDFASKVKCPVFITSSRSEENSWKAIYNEIQSDKTFYLPDFEGYHGAKALWSKNSGNEKYWSEVKKFLSKY